MKFNTRLLHGNFSREGKYGATNIPIYQSTSFSHKTAEELENIFKGTEHGYIYSRINNPTVDAFERRIAFLEKGIGAVACASGMAAITLAVMNIIRNGEEIISSNGIFGGTYSLFNNLEEFGIKTRYADCKRSESFKEAINDRTRMIFIETIGNPKLDVPDIKKIAQIAHKNNIPLIVDNTVTTPYLIKPIELGVDIVIHSTSKYINGSGNSVGGIIVDSGKFKWNVDKFTLLSKYKKYGPFIYLAKLRKGLFKDFGPCASPFNAYLNSLGLETLGIRMDRVCDTANKIALSLRANPKIKEVNYPGLEDNPYHIISKDQFNGKYGGILTIRLGSKDNAFRLINSLKYASNLANIGDTKTLVIHPASTIFEAYSEKEKETMGVFEDLIRISVGLEDPEDLIEDFSQSLDKI